MQRGELWVNRAWDLVLLRLDVEVTSVTSGIQSPFPVTSPPLSRGSGTPNIWADATASGPECWVQTQLGVCGDVKPLWLVQTKVRNGMSFTVGDLSRLLASLVFMYVVSEYAFVYICLSVFHLCRKKQREADRGRDREQGTRSVPAAAADCGDRTISRARKSGCLVDCARWWQLLLPKGKGEAWKGMAIAVAGCVVGVKKICAGQVPWESDKVVKRTKDPCGGPRWGQPRQGTRRPGDQPGQGLSRPEPGTRPWGWSVESEGGVASVAREYWVLGFVGSPWWRRKVAQLIFLLKILFFSVLETPLR